MLIVLMIPPDIWRCGLSKQVSCFCSPKLFQPERGLGLLKPGGVQPGQVQVGLRRVSAETEFKISTSDQRQTKTGTLQQIRD